MLQQIPAVEYECRLFHRVVNLFPIQRAIKLPFRHYRKRVSPLSGFVRVFEKLQIFRELPQVKPRIIERPWIGNCNLGSFFQQLPSDINRR